uniref:Uncharacterized protein n=1 Tax=Periophthalmus magnuspinnatus TaxID=409849 RepID=A0A3B3ZWR9_9GOBI
MEEASCEKAVFVSSFVNNTEDFSVIQGPAARIRPSRLPQEFFTCETPDQPMRPYLKEHLPKRFHFANNERIERGHLIMLFVLLELHSENTDFLMVWFYIFRTKKEMKYCSGGFHGSDNLFKNMQGIFIGYGPGFKHKTVVPTFENIEVYNLMCDLLGIRPAPNNGTHGSLNHLLKRAPFQPVHPAQLSHDTPCDASDPTPSDDLQCNCSNQTPEMVILKTTSSATLRRQHHPFGTPRVVESDVSFCLLHQRDFLSGYSRDRLMPLWVSYTIPPLVSEGTRAEVKVVPPMSPCVRADVRIEPSRSQKCGRYSDDPGLTFGLLHPPYLESQGGLTGSLLTSNMVPMFPAFLAIWDHFHTTLLPKYSQQLNGVNVISGPIFDEDYDGNVDKPKPTVDSQAPTPTHFFLILTSCGNSSLSPGSCSGPLKVQSFILPHRPDYRENCASGQVEDWAERWMKFHTARVRDIELLTGLSFYHDRISVDETLRLKTFLQTA